MTELNKIVKKTNFCKTVRFST